MPRGSADVSRPDSSAGQAGDEVAYSSPVSLCIRRRGVVVIAAGDSHELLRLGQRVEQSGAGRERDHLIVVAVENENGAVRTLRIRGGRKPIRRKEREKSERWRRVEQRSSIRKARLENQPVRSTKRRRIRRHGRAERSPPVDNRSVAV